MRHAVLILAVVLAGAAPNAWAQVIGSLDNLHGKSDITEQDRQQIRAWLRMLTSDLVASTDPELRRMVRARNALVQEGRRDPGWSQAFVQAYGEEAVAALEEAGKRAVSQEARVNLMMAAGDLRRIEGIPLLLKALTEDPYPASRYLAAKGLEAVSQLVVERVLPRVEQTVAQSVDKALQQESNGVTLYYLFETLGRFDHEAAHDVLATGVARAAMRLDASDPAAARALDSAIRALERAYSTEIRPDGKQRIMMAYAVLCVWIMPPVADPNLMLLLNTSLERATGERVGFGSGLDAVMQKLALMEWVEKLARDRRIPARPTLPPAIDQAVEKIKKRYGP